MSKNNEAYPVPSPQEVIVVVRPETALRASAGRFESLASENVSGIDNVLKQFQATMAPLFGSTEERILSDVITESTAAEAPMEDLSVFYKIEVDDEKADDIVAALAKEELVVSAYVKPGSEPAALNEEMPATEEAPPVTPDYVARQGYLGDAPAGINARWAWGRVGGRGKNVRIIDIEGAWRFTHEDLTASQGGVVGGTQSASLGWRNHGTAVLGEYSGDHNGFGISGICDQATASAISIFGGLGSAQAIRNAARRLRRGDVILIELHRPGPRFRFQSRGDQRGYIAIEWWEDDFAAIRFATQRGVIVVEAAGNGAENLDDGIYSQRPDNFPSGWTNPFNRSNRDSGAIVVGAGAPPLGTHASNHGPDRSRLDFSNWGTIADAQGWGREVTTCGYGNLQGGSDEDLWYTDTFSGTSSASPIVVGAIGSLQGIARARNVPVLSPAKVRQCLRTTGSPQQDAPGRPRSQRIGNRPDLRQLVTCAFGVAKTKENIKEFKEFKEKDQKELKEKELKEFKEKDRKELKEKELKELKEKDRKEFKEKDKDRFEKQIEKRIEKRLEKSPERFGASQEPDIENRLSAIEEAVGRLTHFISPELRPDLAAGAQYYANESDETDYELQAKEAKEAKDIKDKELENL